MLLVGWTKEPERWKGDSTIYMYIYIYIYKNTNIQIDKYDSHNDDSYNEAQVL